VDESSLARRSAEREDGPEEPFFFENLSAAPTGVSWDCDITIFTRAEGFVGHYRPVNDCVHVSSAALRVLHAVFSTFSREKY
jgi:hypothetical protein